MSRDWKKTTKLLEKKWMDGDRVVAETSLSETKLSSEPDYVKMYCKDVAALVGLGGYKIDVLVKLASIMNYDNVAVVSPAQRKRWADTLEVSMATINCAFSALIKYGLIISENRGEYIVNPNFFSKGEWFNARQKRDDFEATFTMYYQATPTGYKKKLSKASMKVKPHIDLETGEVKYTRNEKPCDKPTPEDVDSIYNHDDAVDIDSETGEVMP